jgi:8-oxo-dGTP pyrophosphatase MutT (NUDIX family)
VPAPPEIAVFVVRQGSEADVLLLQRALADGGYWHVVAGRVEDGEELAEAARRELREETGLDAELGASCAVIEHATAEAPLPAEAGSGMAVEVTCFVATAPASWEPKLNEEHDAFRWCPWPEAADALRWRGTATALKVLVGRSA